MYVAIRIDVREWTVRLSQVLCDRCHDKIKDKRQISRIPNDYLVRYI